MHSLYSLSIQLGTRKGPLKAKVVGCICVEKAVGCFLLHNHDGPAICQCITCDRVVFLIHQTLNKKNQEIFSHGLNWFKSGTFIRHICHLDQHLNLFSSVSNACSSCGPLCRVMVLDAGKIIEFDSPANLLERRGHFYAMAKDAGITQEDTLM